MKSSAVRSASNADAAGLKAGDRIIAADGLPVHNSVRLTGLLRSYPEGAEVSADLYTRRHRTAHHRNPSTTQLGALGITLEQPEGEEGVRDFQRQMRMNPNAIIPVVIKELNDDMPVAKKWSKTR